MELKLDRAEIEAILLVHVNRTMPEAGFNRVQWDRAYSLYHATFDHTDLPPEKDDE